MNVAVASLAAAVAAALCVWPAAPAAPGHAHECGAPASARFYNDKYPSLEHATDLVFIERFGTPCFDFDGASEELVSHDGTRLTAAGHFDAMLAHVKEFSAQSAPGFRKTGERDGVTYEVHDERTAAAGGAGDFRLSAEIDTDARTFVALMADPQSIFDMDKTYASRVSNWRPLVHTR